MEDITTDIISTTKQIADLVDLLVSMQKAPNQEPPALYIDLEGVNLCREGSVSILTLLINGAAPLKTVSLVDIHTLGKNAFDTAGAKKKTLKDILQSEDITKYFFDVRNDADALFAHFGVALKGVGDVQLMESATRKTTKSREFLSSLAKCIQNEVNSSYDDLERWKMAKERGERLFKPECGGSYEVFNIRPIPTDIIAYCVGDVQYLPELQKQLWSRNYSWQELVREETKKRVEASQRLDYQPHGRNRAMSPWSNGQNNNLDQWNQTAPLQNDFEDLDDYFNSHDDKNEDGEDGYDWYDDGPTSVRDILNDDEIAYYYSD